MEENAMRLVFDSRPENESFARVVISAFMVQLNPTLEQVADVKTAVSEAVTNAVVHGYPGGARGDITLSARLIPEENMLEVEIADAGVGIADVRQALEPFYTTQPELERSGMGFSVMETFMDGLQVASAPGKGTRVKMQKRICPPA
ncbi:MAG: anti-sigma F factor [Christensenellales bacterium]|uniref:Anti-sigma F factor n=1 Tax=Candidatus Avichristensenella intestinipullorum TaxID=2840693 RepID=A0A9D1CJJ5_9FIRM|nr:anti-sigma F factor [Christensenellales bacterium]HIQ63453.1 anti-sigma F factor [Candidatus Avichristensenella intestinipullorum]